MKKNITTSVVLSKLVYYFFIPMFFLLLLASLPLVIGNNDGKFNFGILFLQLSSDYIKGIFDGSSFIFNVGQFEWNTFDELPRYFLVSLFYVMVSSIIGIIIGFPLGIFRYKKLNSQSQNILSFIGTIPDFFIILLLQLFAVYFRIFTGVRFARIAMVTELPLLLPMIAMSLYPILYVTKQVSNAAYEVSCQDYIQFARAKGIKRSRIIFKHIIPALLPGLSTDVTKVSLLVLSNLFIAERLFRIQGITHVLFYFSFNGRTGGYQYDFVISCLLYTFLIYIIIRFTLKFLLLFITYLRGGSL